MVASTRRIAYTCSQEEVDGSSELHKGDEICHEDATLMKGQPDEVPDGGWGWFVVLGCSLMHFLLGGFSRSYGVTYVRVMEKFGSSAAITSWIGGLCVGLRCFLGPISTALSEKYGTRPVVLAGGFIMGLFSVLCSLAPNEYFLFFTYSFGTALGGSLIYSPALVLVNRYFDKHRGIATGISSAGSGLGVFCFPPLIELLFNEYGFGGAFIILGAICFNNCVSASLYRPLRMNSNSKMKSNDISPVEKQSCSRKSLLKSTAQWLEKHFGLSHLKEFDFAMYCLAMTMITLAYIAGHQLLLAVARERGIEESKAVFLLSIIGIADTAGRLLSGFLFDCAWLRQRRQLLYCTSVVLSGSSLLAFGFIHTYEMFVVVCSVQGFFNGCVVSQRAVVVVDIVGVEKLSSCFGLSIACQGFGIVFGPMIAGLLYDIYQTYTPSYIFIGSSAFLGAFIILASSLRHEINSKRKAKQKPSVTP